MRIDSHLLITGENRANASDLMSRLETGDVINAKVLEISPQEAVLRLSDGSIIKAGTHESLNVKPGQTISLSVTSKTDNSIVLETVKTASQTITADTGKLQKMLESLGIKPNHINLDLAAEFLKYDIKPTAENLTEAFELLKASKGLDIEKAVYLAAKGISTDQVSENILDGLLSGNMKLGQLLESINKALNGEIRSSDVQKQDTAIPGLVVPTAVENETAQQTTPIQINTGANEPSLPAFSNAQIEKSAPEAIPSETDANTHPIAAQKAGVDAVSPNVSGEIVVKTNQSLADNNASHNTVPKPADSATDSNTKPNGVNLGDDNLNSTVQMPSDTVSETEFSNKNTISESFATNEQASAIDYENHDISSKAAGIQNNKLEFLNDKQTLGYSLEKSIQDINDSIEKLYVNINKQLSGAELDSGNIKSKLDELVNELNRLTQSSASSKAEIAQVDAAVNHVGDSIKLLDMFNSNNVLYYQIPVRIDNYKSTAELYVMKRHQSKKRIDPNDSVLFLSLDTKNMGRIETILDVKGHNISISLRTESQAVSDFARANIKSLYSALTECGYKLADIRYSIIGSASTPAQQEKLLVDAMRQKHGKVDFRI